MSEELKWAVVIVGGVLLLCGSMFVSCNYQHSIDAKAPVVETCIKHPVTQSPLRGAQH